MKLLVAALLVAAVCTLRLPVQTNQKRCMVVFVYGNGQTVKLHMKFPKSHLPEQQWHVVITDTETDEVQNFNVTEGHFRRELEASQSVLYEVCFWLNSRQVNSYMVFFQSGVNFHVKEAHIKLPADLPKSKDIRDTYRTAERLLEMGKTFREFQDKRNLVQDEKFTLTSEVGSRLMKVLQVELLVLCGIAVLQIIALRKWLKKQYQL